MIPDTRIGLFDLVKFMEYSKIPATFDKAWEHLQSQFADQIRVIKYLKDYYVDDERLIVAKWAAHLICHINNMGLRTTSSTAASHRKIKGFLRYGFNNVIRLVDCVDLALKTIARALAAEESKQITDQLHDFKSAVWLGDLRTRCAKFALVFLKEGYSRAISMHTGQSLRTACHCTAWEQMGFPCWILSHIIENGDIMKRCDIDEHWWLERDLVEYDPLIAIGHMASARAVAGRPRNGGSFNGEERSVFAKQIMKNRTETNTHSMGKKAVDKTGLTSASASRVLSAFEHNSSTLASLDEDDEAANRAAERSSCYKRALWNSKEALPSCWQQK